jgi:hypothetical protein
MNFIITILFILITSFSAQSGEWTLIEKTKEPMVKTITYENSKPKFIQSVKGLIRKDGRRALFVEFTSDLPEEYKFIFNRSRFNLINIYSLPYYGYDGLDINKIKDFFYLINEIEPLHLISNKLLKLMDIKLENKYNKAKIAGFLELRCMNLVNNNKHKKALLYALSHQHIDPEIVLKLGQTYDDKKSYSNAYYFYCNIDQESPYYDFSVIRRVSIYRAWNIKRRKSQNRNLNLLPLS